MSFSEFGNGFIKLIENLGVGPESITLDTPLLTSSYTLTFPDNIGTSRQSFSTGDTPGTAEWVSVQNSWKQRVVSSSVGNVTLSPAPTILDDVNLVSGDRVLIKDQTTTTENGIYTFDGTDFVRSSDSISSIDASGSVIYVTGGSTNKDKIYYCTDPNGSDFNSGLTFEELDIVRVMTGPGTSVDGELARFDGTAGNLIKGSSVLINDSGDTTLTLGNLQLGDGDLILSSSSAQNITHTGSSGQDLVFSSGGNIEVNQMEFNSKQIYFPETNNGNERVILSGPSDVTSSYTLQFPIDLGSTNQVLSTGSTPGNMEWVNQITGFPPNGPIGSVQYIDSGNFAGSSNFLWTNATSALTLNGSIAGVTILGMSGDLTNSAGDVLLTNANAQNITHTGGSGNLIISSGSNVVVDSVTFNNGAMSGISTIGMSGDINSTGDILLISGSAQNITHTGGSGDLTVSSGSNVVVDSVTFNNGAISNITSANMSGNLTSTGGGINLSGTSAQNITHTGQAGQDLTISSGGNVILDTVIIDNGAISNASSVTGTGNFTSGGDILLTNTSASVITHSGGGGDLTIESTNNDVIIDNVTFDNGAINGITSIGTTGDITSGGNVFLTNTNSATITHTGGSGDLVINSGSDVTIETVIFDNGIVTNATDLSLSGNINLIGTGNQSVLKSTARTDITSGSNINIHGVLFNSNSISTLSDLNNTGNIANSVGDILFTNTGTQNITHTGQIGQDLIFSSGSNILIETSTINNGALTTSGTIRSNTSLILEDPGAGTDTITLRAPTLSGDYSFNLPPNNGSSGQLLQIDAVGDTSWVNDPNSPGGPDTAVQFNDSSVYGGSADLTWDETNKLLDISGKVYSNFSVISGTPGLAGSNLDVQPQVFTDNSGGPTTNATFNSFSQSTLAASASTTTTDAATVYIQGSPIQGTNQTITDSYALWVDGGFTKIDENLIIGNNINSTTSVTGVSLTDGTATITGGNITNIGTAGSTTVNVGTVSDGTISMTSGVMTGVITPVSDSNIVNKLYVDNNISGAKWKDTVRLASTTNLSLTGEQTMDGVSAITGDRVLLKDQTSEFQNGIWVVDSGAWARASDMPPGSSGEGISMLIEEGSTLAASGFVCVTQAPNDTVGNDAGTTGDDLEFIQFTGAGLLEAGDAIDKTSNEFSVKTDGTTVLIVADDVQLKDDGISNAKFANNTISTNKIQDSAITNFKLANTSFTINSGDGLQDGGTILLGASTSISVNSTVLRTSGDQSASGVFSFTNNTGSVSSVTGAVTVSGGLGVNENIYLGGNLSTGTGLTGSSITDGTATMTGGNLSGVGSIGAASLTTSGSITADSLTDGVMNLTGGILTGINNVNATGIVTFNSLTDGVATLSGGVLTGVPNPTTGTQVSNKTYVDSLAVTAGDGLTKVGTVFNTNVDNVTIEIFSDELQVKNAGITDIKLNNNAVTTVKIADNAVTNSKLANGGFTLNAGSGIQTVGNINLGDSATVNLDNSVLRITGNQIAAGIQSFTNTTESTNISTGAVKISGGLGIAKNTNVGGEINTGTITAGVLSDGTLSLSGGNFTGLGSISTGTLTTSGTIQGGTITDGIASINSGDITGISTISSSGNFSTSGIITDSTASMENGTLTGLITPTANDHTTNKLYVDSQNFGTTWIAPARAATTANITLSGTQTIDTVLLIANDRVLVKDQTNKVENGAYVVAAGSWSRAGDMSTGAAEDFALYVQEGNVNIGTSWIITESFPYLIGFSNLVWTKFTQGGDINAGEALLKTGSTFDVQVDDVTVEVVSNALQIKDNSMDTVNFIDSSVTTGKIDNSNVTNIKLADDDFTITAGDGLQTGGTTTLSGTITINVDTTILRTTGNQSASGIQTFTNTTQSASTATGGVLNSGGIGVAKNFHVGENVNTTGTVTSGVSLSDGSAIITGGNITGGNAFSSSTFTATGTIQGGTLSDTNLSLTLGSFTGVNSVVLSGTGTITTLTDTTASLTGGILSGLIFPSTNDHATNKDYVDGLVIVPGTDSALSKVSTELFVVVDDDRLEINGSNQIQIKDLGVRAGNIANDSITTAKFFDGDVTNPKLASDTFTVTAGDGLQTGGALVLGSNVTVDIDNTVLRTTGDQSASGIQTFSNTTQSTGFDTGSVVISGGLGITEDLFSTGRIQTNGIIEGNTIGDGTLSFTAGSISGGQTINTGNITASVQVQGGTVTDGIGSLSTGSFVGLINITASGDITITAIPDDRVLFTDNSGQITDSSNLEWDNVTNEFFTPLITTQNITRVGNDPGQLWSNGTGDIVFGAEATGIIQMGLGPMFKLTSTTSVLQSALTIQGNLSRQYVDTTINTASNVTYTAQEVFNGIIFRDCNGASRTDIFPTAEDLVNIIPEPIPGSSMEVLISNISTGLDLLTLTPNTTPGTGTVTFNESLTIASGITARFLVVLNAISFGLWDVTVFASVPKDRVIFQGSFRNAASGGNSTLYCQWGPQTGNTSVVDSTVLGFSGKIKQVVINYSHQSNISIGGGESMSFDVGLSDATLSTFTPFTGGSDIIVWDNTVNGTKPQTSSGPLDIPVQATDRVAIRSRESGSVNPGNMELRCSLTCSLD